MRKKLALIVLIIVVLTAGAGIISAQSAQPETPGARPIAGLVQLILQITAEQTGLSETEITQQLRDGATLAEIITANGASVETVASEVVTRASEQIEIAVAEGRITRERADEALASLPDLVDRILNGEFRLGDARSERGERPAGSIMQQGLQILIAATATETGMSEREILQAVRSGATLAEIIIENGGSVDVVIASATATATEMINQAVDEGRITREAGDEMIAALESTFTEMVNGDLRPGVPGDGQWQGMERNVLQLAAEMTGLSTQEIVQQVRDGATLADILTANGVDPNAFIDSAVAQFGDRLDQAVANGRITQERAETLSAEYRMRLTDIVFNGLPEPARRGAGA